MSTKSLPEEFQREELHPEGSSPDYPELRKQINDFESTFYGPHSCELCKATIVKMAAEQGGHAYNVPAVTGGKYTPHACPEQATDPFIGFSHYDAIAYSVRHLAGKVLTIADATVADDKKCKATKDLIKEAFKHSLDQLYSGCYKLGVVGGCAPLPNPMQPLD